MLNGVLQPHGEQVFGPNALDAPLPEYRTGRGGVASGFTVGLAIGMGGVGSPVLGVLADGSGLRAVMVVLALLPMPAAMLALRLPRKPPMKPPPRP